jgi:hypothetical protein
LENSPGLFNSLTFNNHAQDQKALSTRPVYYSNLIKTKEKTECNFVALITGSWNNVRKNIFYLFYELIVAVNKKA